MTKKRKNIMIGLMIWAGLLLVVLYSPIGSPDLYYCQNYYMGNQYISSPTIIPNTPKRNYSSDNNDVEPDIPDISSHLNTNYSVGSYPSTGTISRGSSYSVQTQSFQNNGSSGFSALGNSSGGSFIANSGFRSSKGSSGIAMTNSINTMSLSTDLINSTTKQSVNNPYTPGTGATDPGGDPTGDPIPVGDGWGLLVFFGVCYACFKRRYSIKNSFFFYLKEFD